MRTSFDWLVGGRRAAPGLADGALVRTLLVCVGVLLGGVRSARAGDPWIRWSTLSTPHFHIHFHSGLEPLAQRLGAVAEQAHQTLVPHLGWSPSAPVDVVLSDDSDSANGLAYAVPYNTIRLFVTAPEDMSALSDYDDWQVELITHEYTHILHTDNITGLPALVNAIFGKLYAPNQAQPRWILEGLAVAMESQRTRGGRLKSSLFDMYLRTDVLADHLATLDEITQSPRRWPGGDLWYLYGSKFIEWILDTYGPDTFARVADDYGSFIIPWGVNRSIRRVTSRTYEELYEGWKQTLGRRYGEQAAVVRARGLREGTRLTLGGRTEFSARFVPPQCQHGKDAELVYYRDDGATRAGFYRRTLSVRDTSNEAGELVTRASGSVASVAPDCSTLFDSVAPSRRRYRFTDLFRLEPDRSDPAGESLDRLRLTIGERAREPDISADGHSIAYVTNSRGTTTLRVAELDALGQLTHSRRLVASAQFEQAFTPRFSPDGRKIAYSAWTAGGYRDVRIVDVASGEFFELFHDRAIDQQPTWSPDGQTLYFASDRSGISNIYAYDLASSALYQVTNVLTGAYMPAVSPDGRTLVYTGYTAAGFDLFALPLDRAHWLAPPPPAPREDGRSSVVPEHFPVKSYNPLPTLRPRAYTLDFGTSTLGNALTIATTGTDAVGYHTLNASATFETQRPEWHASADYTYSRLPFNLRVSAFRSRVPRTDYRIGETAERVFEHAFGVTTGIGFDIPGEFDSQSLAFSFTVADYEHDSPIGTRPDPYAPVPVQPASGPLAAAHLGYSFGNAEATLYSISPERGFTAFLGADFGDPTFGSSDTWAAFYGSITGYVPLPWRAHHVLALALSGGSNGGSYPRRGAFVTGGFADQPVIDVYTSGIRQSGFVLRGFKPGQFVGPNYTLVNAEYRFPIWYVDRGVSTLPVFLQQFSGNVFTDWGGAYSTVDRDHPTRVLHLGAGAELWIELMLGYNAPGSLRLGVARGFGADAPHGFQTYFVAASAF